MKLIIDIPDETFKYYVTLANKGEQIGRLERIILDGKPLPAEHGDLVEMKCVDKCFICGKEIQRNSIPRIEELKIDKIMLSKDKKEHLVCDSCGNLLTIMYKMLKEYNR